MCKMKIFLHFESLKNEGKQSKERESNSILLFGSFLKGEEFGGVSTTFNLLFLIAQNWKDLERE